MLKARTFALIAALLAVSAFVELLVGHPTEAALSVVGALLCLYIWRQRSAKQRR